VFSHDSELARHHLEKVAERTKTNPNAFLDLQDLLLRSTMQSFVALSMGGKLDNLENDGIWDSEGRYSFVEMPFSTAFVGCVSNENFLWLVLIQPF
jgi:hypothetical protein